MFSANFTPTHTHVVLKEPTFGNRRPGVYASEASAAERLQQGYGWSRLAEPGHALHATVQQFHAIAAELSQMRLLPGSQCL